jgi:DNA-binding transcriptional regulator LsrR (DeoR family)
MPTSEDQLVRIAWQYYIEDLTQQEIANRFHLSRPKVARILKEARDRGIVEFHINGVPIENLQSEQQLRELFDLKDAIVIPSLPHERGNRRELGKAAARYLETMFETVHTIGLGMGRTLAEIPQFVTANPKSKTTFVEIVGGVSRTDSGLDTYNISWLLADRCGGVAIHVNSPVVVRNVEMRNMLLDDPQITAALDMAKNSALALVGVGTVSDDITLVRQGYFDETTVLELIENGAVGDIIGHYLDLHGRPVDSCIEDRLVGLSLDQIAEIPMVIGVAGWIEKAKAILSALRSGCIDVLITDYQTAQAVFKLARKN